MANCVDSVEVVPSAVWAPSEVLVGGAGSQLAGASKSMRRVTILNDPYGGNDVFLVSSQSMPFSMGFILVPGSGIEIDTRAAVYAKTNDTSLSATVYVITESGF